MYVRIEMYLKMAIYALLGTVQKKIQLQAWHPVCPFLVQIVCHGHRMRIYVHICGWIYGPKKGEVI